MKAIKHIFILLFSIILVVFLTIGIFLVIGFLQEKVFVPNDYELWIFKYPASRFVIIYELYLIFGIIYFFYKDVFQFRNDKFALFKKYRKGILSSFIILNLILTYAIFTSVTVITKNNVVDYSPLNPFGEKYHFTDIRKIETGIYGKQFYLPFTHSKGDFYYTIELKDRVKIDLNEVGGMKDSIDHRFILEQLDEEWVNVGITKEASLENFEYTTKTLDKMYTDKIRNMIENRK